MSDINLQEYVMLAFFLSILAVFAFPLFVFAGETLDGGEVVEHIFNVADTNEDGALSDDEYADAQLSDFGLTFEQCDTNQDGRLSPGEYLDLYNAHHAPVDEKSD